MSRTGWLIPLIVAGLGGCESTPSGTGGLSSERDTAGLRASERTVRVTQPGSSRSSQSNMAGIPAAVVGGETLTMDQIAPYLAEASGALVLEDLLITRVAESELARSGRALTQSDLEQERAEFARALGASSPGTDTEQLIDAVRRSRGLGPERFGLLVRRTAALRKLVSSDVTVEETDIALAYRVRYGPRVRVRMILAATERDAAAMVSELRAMDPGSRRARFIQLAMDRSSDSSGSAGGLLEPISPADPAYPLAVRTTIASLQPGELSPVIAISPNYAIVLAEELIPDQNVGIESVRASLRDDLRRRQERLLMDRKARAIVDTAGITVIDPSLQWSWRTREGRREP